MSETQEATIRWDQLDRLTDPEVAALVEAATSVLEWSAEEEGIDPVSEMPPSALTTALRGELEARGVADDGSVARQIVRQQSARPVAMLLLRRIAQEPALAARVEEVYRERKRLLVVDPATLSAAALLILVLKLKKIKVGKIEISLEMLSTDTLKSLFGFLGKPAP